MKQHDSDVNLLKFSLVSISEIVADIGLRMCMSDEIDGCCYDFSYVNVLNNQNIIRPLFHLLTNTISAGS